VSDHDEINGPASFDLGKNARVQLEFFYPDFSAPEQPSVTVGLCHVRAADAITIHFDGERNGYVIEMDRTREADWGMEIIEERCEVAFVPAWNVEPAPAPIPEPPVATPEQIEAVRALLVGMPKKIRGHADGPCVGDRCLEIHFIGSLGKRFYFQDDTIAGEGALINVYGDWNLHACAYDAVYGLRLATMTDLERIDFSAALA
jgi:hypothetical protein